MQVGWRNETQLPYQLNKAILPSAHPIGVWFIQHGRDHIMSIKLEELKMNIEFIWKKCLGPQMVGRKEVKGQGKVPCWWTQSINNNPFILFTPSQKCVFCSYPCSGEKSLTFNINSVNLSKDAAWPVEYF